MKTFVLVQRITRTIGNAIHGQNHGKVVLGYWHRAMLFAMDDGNGRTPVALAAHPPVAQTPGGFLLTQAFGGQSLGHSVHRFFVRHTTENIGIDSHTTLLVAVPVLPLAVVVGQAIDVHDVVDREIVFFGKCKVALVVRGHAHHGAIAIAHQHVVAHPNIDWAAGQWVGHLQARGHAQLFLDGQLGFRGATGFAFFNERCQTQIRLGRMHCQRMFGCNGAKSHAHDGVRPGGEHVHAAVIDERATAIADVVRERKTHTFALADPVLLHQAHAIGPSIERRLVVAQLHMVQQLLGVVGDLQVITRDFALFYRRAGAPALAVNHLLISQHGLVHRVPIHHLGLAVGNALFQHFQKQPLVPLVVFRRTGGDFTAPVDGQAEGLHLALHIGDVLERPLRRRHTVFQRGVLGGQAKRVPAHGHQHVVAVHAQVARQHVVDGVVAHMAHVQLAAGVRQHGAGVKLFARRVLGHLVGITAIPQGLLPVNLGSFFEVGVLVFVLHGACAASGPRCELPKH